MASPPDRRHGLVTFFAITFGTTWLLQLPAILAERGRLAGPASRYGALVVFGYFVPTIASLVLSRRNLGGEGVGTLLRRFGGKGVGAGWYLVALVHSPVILAAGMLVARAALGTGAGRVLYPPSAPAQVAAMLVVPFVEQIPWRGFVYPVLERRLGPLGGSLVVGAAWGLFHLQKQALLRPGLAPGVAAWLLLLMTAGTVVFTWFYRRTGSMLAVVVAHAGIYLSNPVEALPGNATPLAVHALAYSAVAVILVLADRTAWRTPARDATTPPIESPGRRR